MEMTLSKMLACLSSPACLQQHTPRATYLRRVHGVCRDVCHRCAMLCDAVRVKGGSRAYTHHIIRALFFCLLLSLETSPML